MSNQEPNQGHGAHDFDGIVERQGTRPPAYFYVLFYGLIIWAVAFSAFYLLSGWSSDAEFKENMAQHQAKQGKSPAPEQQTPAAAAPVAEQAAATTAPDGAALYAASCAMCHGQAAKGGIGPDLTTQDYQYGKQPEAVIESISKGRAGGMPAFGNQLSDAEITAISDYIRSL